MVHWRGNLLSRVHQLSFANFGFDVSGILCSPATGDGIVAIGGRDGFLYAIDINSGKQSGC
jgi:outer membrane protein assembly factor BamB